MKTSKIILVLFTVQFLCLLIPNKAFGQTEKLGIVSYTSPQGWTKDLKQNVVGFSKLNQKTGGFCIISLYGATPGSKNSTADFVKEWNYLVGENMKAEAVPQTDTQNDDGWTLISGGSAVESEVGKAVAFLTVISGYGKTISILAVFNDPGYVKDIDNFIKDIDIDKSNPSANTTSNSQPTYDSNGRLIVPLPTRQLTVADFEGEWGEDASRVTTNYVYRSSGGYAGSDTLAFRSKMTITKNGGYINDFFAIQNGKKIIDKTNGTIAVNGIVFSITQKNTAKYVIRGWLELPDMTIMILCGPLAYDNDAIPENIFTNPAQGANLNNTWVRKK
jgi:hypothetical protein